MNFYSSKWQKHHVNNKVKIHVTWSLGNQFDKKSPTQDMIHQIKFFSKIVMLPLHDVWSTKCGAHCTEPITKYNNSKYYLKMKDWITRIGIKSNSEKFISTRRLTRS